MLGTTLVVAALASTMVPKRQAETAVLANPRGLPDLALINARTGSLFGRQQLKGRWTLLYSGYLNCPDLCPTTLGLFARLNSELQPKFARQSLPAPQFVFVSIDHFRDSAQNIADYADAFDAAVTPLTGTPQT